jgi:uncharacterized membrane protein YccC
MRLKTHTTWSQQQLAMKLRMEQSGGLLSWEHQRLLIHAAKTALAAGLCWWIALRFGWHDGYWGSISAIIVLQSNVGSTVSASRDRMLGTLIGALFGFASTLFGTLPWNYVIALIAAVIVCGLLGLRNSSRLAGVTITIVMLVKSEGSHWTIALDRVGQVLLGIIMALVVSTLVFPDRARLRLRDGLAQEFLVLGMLFEAILQGFRGVPAEHLQVLREDALALLEGNNQLMDAARNEPSGTGWREGLSMLAQFGRSIFDALAALEIAVKDSCEDAYAQQLEPALGQLAIDIRSGFNYVARCIHDWRFHVAPPGLNLEEDIAQLEARMNEVRHTGSQFSQAEILRAYAVQLHLKQIARLLRASRVGTSRAVGEAQK